MIIYTARGFGASGGSIHLDHPDFEGADAVKIIDLAASRPEVARTGDDPVIGVAGASYGGAVSLIAAGLDPRVDAIVPAFTFNRLNQALFPQYAVAGEARSLADVTPTGGPGVFKRALGVAAVRRRNRPRPGPAGRRPGLRPVHRRAVPGLSRRGRVRPARPEADRAARGDRTAEPAGQDHRADPDHRRRGRHPLPARPGRRQPARTAGRDAGPAHLGGRRPRRRAVGGRDPRRPDRLVRPLPEGRRVAARLVVLGAGAGDLPGRPGRHPRSGDPGRPGVPGPRSRADRPAALPWPASASRCSRRPAAARPP